MARFNVSLAPGTHVCFESLDFIASEDGDLVCVSAHPSLIRLSEPRQTTANPHDGITNVPALGPSRMFDLNKARLER